MGNDRGNEEETMTRWGRKEQKREKKKLNFKKCAVNRPTGGRNTGEEHGGGLTKEKGGSVGVSGGAEESRERRSKEFLKVSLEGKGNKG